MSQDRLSQDHQIGRDLDRDIESLRGNGKRYHYLLDGTPIEYSIPEDKGSRKLQLTTEDNETPPEMPKRPKDQSPPSLPRRKYLDEDGPPLPQRKVSGTKPIKPAKPSFSEKKYEVEILQPVARPSAPPVKKDISITEKYGLKKFTPTTLTGHRSFADIETSIRNGKPEVPSKPPKPAKTWLNSSIQASKPYHETNAPKPNSDIAKLVKSPKKESTFDVNDIHREKNSNSWIDSVVNKSPKREEAPIKPIRPPKPQFKEMKSDVKLEVTKPEISKPEIAHPESTKPTIAKLTTSKPEPLVKDTKPKPIPPKPSKPNFQQQDNELLLAQLLKLKSRKTPPPPKNFKELDVAPLKNTLGRLSPTKGVKEDKSNLGNYKDADNALLNSQLNKIKEKPIVKAKPVIDKPAVEKTLIEKPVIEKPGKKPSVEKPPIKDKPIIKKPVNTIQPINQNSNNSQTSLNSIDFKSQLSSILRSNTDPTSPSPPVQIQRSNTEPTKAESKLTHPNKSRSKGPKRRLPKSFKNEKSSPIPEAKSKPPIKPKPKSVGDLKSKIDFDVFI